MITIGFTGTRRGMSPNQFLQFGKYFGALSTSNTITEFHHGAAVGADTEAAELIAKYSPDIKVVAHPAGADPLARNHDIVAASTIIIAAPYEDTEVLRSGTWATIRFARKAGVPVIILPR